MKQTIILSFEKPIETYGFFPIISKLTKFPLFFQVINFWHEFSSLQSGGSKKHPLVLPHSLTSISRAFIKEF